MVDVGRVGIWTFQLDGLPVSAAREMAAELEDLGYGALWLPEAAGRDPLVHAALLLQGTRHLIVATGIANIWMREPMAMAAAQRTLAEAFSDRFLLGLGASHGAMVEGWYAPPLNARSPAVRAWTADRLFTYLRTGLSPSHAAAAGPWTAPLRALFDRLNTETAADGRATYSILKELEAALRDHIESVLRWAVSQR